MRHWWEDAVFYQIYPRSFMDSNGDGIGDIRGIESKLDHIVSLGADALWISPFFPSPMKDFGYDVSDYRGIDPIFGTLDDFKSLLVAGKRQNLHVVLDLVANHSSDEHPWFKEARSSRSNPLHGWYLWVEDKGRPPNNWKAIFELSSAWHRNEATGERYLGTFTKHQPEFDWRNPAVRREFNDIMSFWYDMGVDGFRLDVATAYIKDAELRSNPFSPRMVPDLFQRHIYDRNRPEVHEIFKEMRAIADRAGERVLIGETHGQDHALAASCHGRANDELHMAFNFDFLRQPWKAEAFRASAERWYAALPEGAWPNFTLSNHDQNRHAWRYRGRTEKETDARSRVAAAMLLTLKGTPFFYYGEEIGMTCVRIPRQRLRDPLGIRTWPFWRNGRDQERTPMQWDSSPGAGFTQGKAWLPINPDWHSRNVAAQEVEVASLLAWYRSLLKFRKATEELRCGGIAFIDVHRHILAYDRKIENGPSSDSGGIRVLLNFSAKSISVKMRRGGSVLLGTEREIGSIIEAGSIELHPYEVLIYAMIR
jgi:alpha-glucosidase